MDYDSNPHKQEQDLSVFTYKQAQEDNNRKITEHILQLKDPRIRRLFFSGNSSHFEHLIAYIHGIAFAAIDEHSAKRIWGAEAELFKECGGNIDDPSASILSS